MIAPPLPGVDDDPSKWHASRLQFTVKLAVGLVGGGGAPPVLSSTIVQAANAPAEAFVVAVRPPAEPAGARPPSVATESILPLPEADGRRPHRLAAGQGEGEAGMTEFFAAQ